MKKVFILICTLFTLTEAQAQCPQYVAFDTSVCHSTVSKVIDARVLTSRLCGDSVQIIFNDSLTSLSGSRQVYFHAGPEFRPFTGFQAAYTADSAMRKIGAHLWSIKINPRNFFHYSSDSCLNSIACGFRDSAFVHYVKDGNNDIFILTYTGAATTSYPYITCTYTHHTTASYLWNDGRTDSVRLFTASGFYSVTATGVGGCTASGTVHIRIGTAQVSLGDDTIHCTTGYVVIATQGFSSYRWGNGTTSSTYIGFKPGRIWIQATDSVGCTSYDTVTVHYSQAWGLKLGDTLSSCPGTPVSADASININRAGDSLVIIYDATQGQTQLATDTNVYFHSGPEFRPFSGWQGAYTVGHYGQNDGVGRMTSLGNRKWRIVIDPQAYYGYLPDSNLNGIFMIFRNFDGTKTGKDASGNNIYIYTNGVFPFHNQAMQPTCSFAGVVPSLKARQPLYYAWSNGVHTAADTFTTGGLYTVTVSDGVCSRVDSVRAIFSTTGSVSLGPDTTVCAGQHVVISAGTGFAHYIWSTGDTTAFINVTNAATYTVTATSAGGCQSTGTRRVINSVHQVSLGSDITRCSTTAVTLTATPGFVSYSWIGKPAVATSTYPAVNAGCYRVAARDSAGCTSYDTVRVINSQVLALSPPDSITSCPGNSISVDASTSITQNGDSLIIIYDATKHGGADSLVGASKVYMHSGPEFHPFQGWVGAYTVGNFGLDDGVGQMDSLGNNKWRIAIIPQCYYGYSPDTPLNGIWMIFRNANGSHTGKDYNNTNIFIYTAVTPPTCSFNGVTPSRNAASGTTYSWTTPSGPVSGPTVNVNTNGLYIVTATAGICSKSDTIHANFVSNTTLHLGAADTTICFGDSATIDAGAGYTHYTWSNADTTRAIIVKIAGTYSITATNGSGCSSIGQIVVNISHPSVSLGSDIVKCDNSAATITAPAGFASYQWIGRAPSSRTFSATHTGSYWVVATDSFGCRASDTVSVRYSEVLQLSLQDTFNSCPGNQVGLDAGSRIQVYGDSITILYDATQGQTGLIGASKVYMHSGPEFHPFQGWVTQYTVGHFTQDDGIGRMDSLGNNRWKITIFPQAYYGYSPDTPLNGIWMVFRNANGTQTGKDAAGNNIFLNLSGITPTCSFSGVTAIHKEAGILAYAWSNGDVAPSIAVSTTGYYSVTVSDGTCSHSDTTFVNLNSTLSIHIGNDTAICPSGRVRFDAGAGYSHYHWSTGDTTQAITASAAGSYAVTVTNAQGCTASDTVVVRINGAKVNAGADVTRCNKLPVTLSASSGFRSYQWFGLGSSSQTHSAVNDGCYWVLATDSAGCTSYDTVSVATSGVEGLHSHDTVHACIGNSASFDASVSINASGDSLVIRFDATLNGNSSPLLGARKVYMHSAPQFYPFAPWPANDPYTVGNFGQDDGVGEMDSVGPNKWQITICPSCYYHYNPDSALNGIWMVFRNANGTQQNSGGNINLYVAGGTPTTPYAGVSGAFKSTNNISYSWSNSSSGSVGTFSAPGTYYVTATDGSCSKTDTLTVYQNAGPVVNLGNDTCLNAGHALTLNAGSGFTSYLWSTGASTQTITANLAGTYWVRVTNATGCTGSDSIVVLRGVTVYLGGDTCISAGGSDLLNAGAGATLYLWNTGATTDTFRVTATGVYSVTVSQGGCTGADSIVIHSGVPVNLGRDTCINTGGSYLISAGTGATSYLWNTGSVKDTLRVTAAGTYSVVVSENGCTGTDTIVISICNHTIPGCLPIPYFRVLNVSPFNTVTFKDSSSRAVTYSWNFGDGTPIDTFRGNTVHTYASNNIYTVTLIECDSCGCDTFTRTVNVNYTGITEISGLSDIRLYPNPASNSCTLSISAVENTQAKIEVNNILGAEVQNRKWQVTQGENKLTLDVSDMSSGMYTVTIRTASGILTRKLDIIK
jgi:hypothetical protein